MNEQTTTQDRLAEEIDALLAPYPDPMSRNDFRIACHIGTRTSLYLLQSGLVPCLHTGKRTRCYKIAKADVAAYLRRRLTEPEHYAPPSGWYKNYPQRKPPAVSLTRTLDYEIVSRLLLRRHLEQQLADTPDVLTVEQIARFTATRPTRSPAGAPRAACAPSSAAHGSWCRKRGCWTIWSRMIITRSRGRVGNIMG